MALMSGGPREIYVIIADHWDISVISVIKQNLATIAREDILQWNAPMRAFGENSGVPVCPMYYPVLESLC